MTDFATQLLNLWSQYQTWLVENPSLEYGAQSPDSAYGGGGIAPSFEGFMKWTEFIFLPAQQPAQN